MRNSQIIKSEIIKLNEEPELNKSKIDYLMKEMVTAIDSEFLIALKNGEFNNDGQLIKG